MKNNVETFDLLIAGLDSGAVNGELTREMRALVEAINERALADGKAKGSLTVKLTIAAENNGRVDISVDATSKRPSPRRSKEVRWVGKNGQLLLSDPRQETLPLRTPGAGTGVTTDKPMRRVDAAE